MFASDHCQAWFTQQWPSIIKAIRLLHRPSQTVLAADDAISDQWIRSSKFGPCGVFAETE
jgi:hypothetical protein